MPTNKIILKEPDEFMAGYNPIYQPIYPLFLAGGKQYAVEVGKNSMRAVKAVSDIRAKHILPKDTEIRQIAVMEGKKEYKKYFLANQYTQSTLQDSEGNEDVVKQVLDEHQKQADELLLTGEGTSASDVINNGLFYSADDNYLLKNSAAIAAGDTRLYDFHTKVTTTAQEAAEVAGRKLILFYGSDVIGLYNSLFNTAAKSVSQAIKESLPDYSLAQIPSSVTPAASNGWIIVNLDQTQLHYTQLPALTGQGVNEEKMYSWHNFLMGSMMMDVKQSKGIIRQPTTLAS